MSSRLIIFLDIDANLHWLMAIQFQLNIADFFKVYKISVVKIFKVSEWKMFCVIIDCQRVIAVTITMATLEIQ